MDRMARGVASLWMILGVAAGCGPTEGPADGGRGDDASVGCPVPLVGAAPFGAVLSGEHAYEADGETVTRTDTLNVWFPEGRRRGGPVLIASPERAGGGLTVTTGILDEHLGAAVSWLGKQGTEDFAFDGRLVGPDGGLEGELYRNLAPAGSDVVLPAHGAGRLCPAAAPPEAVLTTGGCAGPTSTLRWASDVPVDPYSVSATAGDGIGVRSAGDFSGWVHVVPDAAFPPNTAPEVTVSARDVLGRPFSFEGTRRWLHTGEVVSDLSFETAPPAAAIDTCPREDVAVEGGALVLAPDPAAGTLEALVALFDPGAAGALRVALTAWGCSATELAVVGADGSATRQAVDWTSGDTSAGPALALPSSGPLWLTLRVSAARFEPQSAPPPPCEVRVESLAFE